MKQQYSSHEIWGRAASKIAMLVCLVIFIGWNFTAAFAQSSVIHVAESGASFYVGAAGLKQALLDVTDPGTIYVHSGTYDLGATATSFLTITKAVTLVGFDDGTGKPVIKGARPSGIAGVIFVNAPGKAVVLNNLEISYYGTRAVGTGDYAVYVQGSNSFTVQNCTITSAFFDGTINRGVYASIGVEGLAQSEFPTSPNYPLRNNVRGDIKIRNSTLTGWITNISIGFAGPVSLDNIELSNCTLNVLGAPQLGNTAKGNFGFFMMQYPRYMTDANRSSLIEATHTGTNTIIKNNTITAPNTVFLLYLKGVQRVEKNRLYSPSAWFSAGKYYQSAIAAWGYPHNVSDPATYSEAIIRDNVIDLQIPPFPIVPTTFYPPQTTDNTFPATAIWLGVGGRIFYASSITGHHAKAMVTGNIISSRTFSASSPLNPPDYGLYLRSEMKNCVIAGNHLAGGRRVDPIDRRVKSFEPFTAKVAQVYVGPEAHDNYFGPATRHEWLEDSFEPTDLTGESTELNYWGGRPQPGNTFGPAEIAGVLCYGQNNQFRDNQFLGNYEGWEPGDGPGLYWLTDTTYRNRIGMTRLNGRGLVFNLCRQFYDETDWGWNRYQGLNYIQGFGRCHPKSAEFVQRMLTLKKTIEERLEKF